jgi:hypothetical protein
MWRQRNDCELRWTLPIARLQRFEIVDGSLPGALPQAITFRAFGAGSWSFDPDSKLLGNYH